MTEPGPAVKRATHPPMVRGTRVALIVATGLLVLGTAGFAVFGFNAWSLMAVVVGGPVLMVAGAVWLFQWAGTAARLRGVLSGARHGGDLPSRSPRPRLPAHP